MALKLFIASLISIFPGIELRGAIPFAVLLDTPSMPALPIWLAFVFCTSVNFLCVPINFFFLDHVNQYMLRFGWWERFYNHKMESAQRKVKPKIDKYGYLGLLFFVSVPLPVTGAYTGTIAAWLFKLDRRKAFLYICGGVVIAGIIISTLTYLILTVPAMIPDWVKDLFLKDEAGIMDKARYILYALAAGLGLAGILFVVSKLRKKGSKEPSA